MLYLTPDTIIRRIIKHNSDVYSQYAECNTECYLGNHFTKSNNAKLNLVLNMLLAQKEEITALKRKVEDLLKHLEVQVASVVG